MHDSSNGMNQMFFERLRNFQCLVSLTKWFHKATFWHQVNFQIKFSLCMIPILFNCCDSNLNFLSHAVGGGNVEAL